MEKGMEIVMTNGVKNLGLSQDEINRLFRKAEELRPRSAFLVFDPKGNSVYIGNGDGHILGMLHLFLPEKVWVIFDDYGDRWVATALLPREH